MASTRSRSAWRTSTAARRSTTFPADVAQLAACEPVYDTLPGWSQPTKGVRRFSDLPETARRYIGYLEDVSGVPAAVISTGSEREDTILRDDVLDRLQGGLTLTI